MKTFKKLDSSDIGKTYSIPCIIQEIVQTRGPTVFVLHDGTSRFRTVSFSEAAGKRAFPSLIEQEGISADIEVSEHKGNVEGKLLGFKRLSEEDVENILGKMEEEKSKRYKPQVDSFMIDSELLEGIKEDFKRVSSYIRQTVLSGKPIVIRHHADCDGYCAGIAMEKAITPLIESYHHSDKALFTHLKRFPCQAPFYDITDANRDIEGRDIPLVILCDLGDQEQSRLAYKKARVYDMPVIIIDHHQDNLPEEVTDAVHSPDSNVTAGMIACELARFIDSSVQGISELPALAGTGDRSDCQEMEKYVELSGLDKGFLSIWAKVLDFEASQFRYSESRKIIPDLLGNRRQEIIEIDYNYIEEKTSLMRKAIDTYKKVETIGKTTVVKIDIDSIDVRWAYPGTRNMARIAHDLIDGPHLTVAHKKGGIVFRANGVSFSMSALMKILEEKFPHSLVEGGGHECAGSVHFASAAQDEIETEVYTYIETLD